MDALPLGAQVAVAREEDSFAVTASGGYLPKRHLVPLANAEPDFVAVAERFRRRALSLGRQVEPRASTAPVSCRSR